MIPYHSAACSPVWSLQQSCYSPIPMEAMSPCGHVQVGALGPWPLAAAESSFGARGAHLGNSGERRRDRRRKSPIVKMLSLCERPSGHKRADTERALAPLTTSRTVTVLNRSQSHVSSSRFQNETATDSCRPAVHGQVARRHGPVAPWTDTWASSGPRVFRWPAGARRGPRVLIRRPTSRR